MSAAVLIKPTGDALVCFEFSYAVVEELKVRIPPQLREWQPGPKQWVISAGPFVPVIIDILQDCYGVENVHITDERVNMHDLVTHASDDPYSALHLRPTAPPELVQAAYKTLARLHHPDSGGSTVLMQELNSAVAILRERGAV